MGILGELSQIAKAGHIEQLNEYLNDETNAKSESSDTLDTPRKAGAHRRTMHHDAEISFASFR